MNEQNLGIFIFAGIVMGVSIFFQFFFKRIFISSVLAALCSSIIFLFVNYLHIGYLDPFFKIAFFINLVVGFFISIIVQYVMSEFKARR